MFFDDTRLRHRPARRAPKRALDHVTIFSTTQDHVLASDEHTGRTEGNGRDGRGSVARGSRASYGCGFGLNAFSEISNRFFGNKPRTGGVCWRRPRGLGPVEPGLLAGNNARCPPPPRGGRMKLPLTLARRDSGRSPSGGRGGGFNRRSGRRS